MIRERFGRVINIASVVGPRANAGQANYAAAKAGLIGMTKTIAVEVARRGVTVNAIAPGLIETDMTADLDGELLERSPRGAPARPRRSPRALASSPPSGRLRDRLTLYVDGGLVRLTAHEPAKGPHEHTVTKEQIEKVVIESLASFGADPDADHPRGDVRGARHRLARPRRALADRRTSSSASSSRAPMSPRSRPSTTPSS